MKRRAVNFSHSETKKLLELTHDCQEIIENKNIDKVTTEKKRQAWKDIVERFNASFPDSFREEKVLRIKYGNLKKDARREMRKMREKPSSVSPEDETLMSTFSSDIIQLQPNTFAGAFREDKKPPVNISPERNSSPEPQPQNKKSRVEPLDDWIDVAQRKLNGEKTKEQQENVVHDLQIKALQLQIEHSKKEHELKKELLRLQIEEQKIKLENMKLLRDNLFDP